MTDVRRLASSPPRSSLPRFLASSHPRFLASSLPRILASSLPRLLAAIAVLGLGCVSVPGEPISRKLNATLVSPNGDEGAALIELTGSGLRELTVKEGRVFTTGTDQRVRAVIVLDEPGLLRFQIAMDDPNAAISATVLEVADGNNEVRTSLTGYDVAFTR